VFIRAVVLVGPTAVGKTELSLWIAEDHFEIISADSVQVYRYLNIGSGKPAGFQRQLITHHLIDIVDPDYWFTAGDFCRRAMIACEEIQSRGKIPLFVGGTGLYIDSFFKGLSDVPDVDHSYREQLHAEIEERGLEALYEELKRSDSEFAEQIHPHDRQRIVRGLEIYRAFGKPLSAYHREKGARESEKTLYLGLTMERDLLRKTIDRRVDTMIADGFVDEVIGLREMGYGPELNAMRSIGYLQMNEYLDRKLPFDEAVECMKRETKRYAKRQMTWFRKNPTLRWFHRTEALKVKDCVHQWLHDRCS
jgi:tRNA dimethylallyltransferase